MIKVFCSPLGSKERAQGDTGLGGGKPGGRGAFTGSQGGGAATERCPRPGITRLLFAHPWCQGSWLLIKQLLQTISSWLLQM